jgi:sulfite reductase (ferredoxin)
MFLLNKRKVYKSNRLIFSFKFIAYFCEELRITMQSFQTELENPLVEKDIIDLEKKIRLFQEGKIHEEKFRSLRLARGVYGQRQKGVQMVRIKLPYGKMTFKQWKRIADISDEYSTGNLHLTTRQDVQIHFVSLDRTPELWAKLEQDEITLREACGNTVRNITASVTSGIDVLEPFDVTKYAQAAFQYFLRNPICQEMGRKIKMAFSNSDEDTALTFMHDVGFIPKFKNKTTGEISSAQVVSEEGLERGFRVVVGGGLGAQPMLAKIAHEFLPENQAIPYIEAVLRVFDRHGERNSRSKARMKFLIQKIGFEAFQELVAVEMKALKNQTFEVPELKNETVLGVYKADANIEDADKAYFDKWLAINVIPQKQAGFSSIFVKIRNGNIDSETSRSLVAALEGFIADDVRITLAQDLLLRFVPQANLAYVFNVLKAHDLAELGANRAADITSCPGTDTCNLAISDSTHITQALESVILNEFPDLIQDSHIKIKISGCMNSCGQHGMANIGFHGSSLKNADKKVLPALQVLLGGGNLGNGEGRIADKVLKVPSKRGPDVLRVLLSNYEVNALEGEYFNDFYLRNGEKYFYELLKPLTDLSTLINTDFIDWGAQETFATEIGVGECASVIIDLVQTLIFEGEEKLDWAKTALSENRFADAIYFSYQGQLHAAKALLLDKDVSNSTQNGVINDFDKHYEAEFGGNFKTQILAINQNEPTEEFANEYFKTAVDFVKQLSEFRQGAMA